MKQQLFNAQAADGSSAIFKHIASNSVLNVYVSGDLGGGILAVEAQTPDGLTWEPISGGKVSESGVHAIFAAPFVGRVTLSGSTNASLTVWVEDDSADTQARVEAA